MTTNRLYTVFGLMIVLGVVTAAVLATSLGVGGLKPPSISVSVGQPAGIAVSSSSADKAYYEFRRGEWFGGRDVVGAAQPLTLELQRYLWYHGVTSFAALNDQARLDFRKGEWFGGRDMAEASSAADAAHYDFRRGEWAGR
jgi:hypothetical protein